MSKLKGFTILELLITIILVSILSVLGMSSYSSFIAKNEESVIIDELRNAIQYAKMQAIILDVPVYLMPLDALGNWSEGITLNLLNDSVPVYQWQWQHPQWHLKWQGVQSRYKIVFSNTPADAISNGRFVLLNINTQKQTEIILNRLGNVKVISSLKSS